MYDDALLCFWLLVPCQLRLQTARSTKSTASAIRAASSLPAPLQEAVQRAKLEGITEVQIAPATTQLGKAVEEEVAAQALRRAINPAANNSGASSTIEQLK